jgi:SpoVK/Ycf46/Vps4 family AAA+-type ATPase
MLHCPLYNVSLGQLGASPSQLETRLGEILDLCSRWDSLILLDEADIFLEKRSSTGSLERNAMVSVMLRLVEYFKGTLFLTSNRVDALDPAFKTRITLALRYDPLDQTARKQVWINLLQSSGFGSLVDTSSVSESIGSVLSCFSGGNTRSSSLGLINVEKLAIYELNGREIKNAIRLAMALAEEDQERLSQELILETIESLNDFNEKMKKAERY